jgi:thiol:disulfide interchange protein
VTRTRVMLAAATAVLLLAACNTTSKITQDAPATPSAAEMRTNATATATATASADADAHGTGAKGVRVVVAPQDADALSVVRTERLRAKAEGRVLVVYAGAAWCEPCKRFKNAIQTGSLDDKLAKTTLLVFDADRDTDRLAAAGYTFQFIPYVAVPGADGHPTDSIETRAKGSESWRELIGKLETWQAAAASAVTKGP